jgi:hypothetical protein
MQRKITAMLAHLAKTHGEMARIMEAERHVVTRMAHKILELPDGYSEYMTPETMLEQSSLLVQNLIEYLNGIAELEEAMAETLSHVMRETDDAEEE